MIFRFFIMENGLVHGPSWVYSNPVKELKVQPLYLPRQTKVLANL